MEQMSRVERREVARPILGSQAGHVKLLHFPSPLLASQSSPSPFSSSDPQYHCQSPRYPTCDPNTGSSRQIKASCNGLEEIGLAIAVVDSPSEQTWQLPVGKFTRCLGAKAVDLHEATTMPEAIIRPMGEA